MFFPFNYTNNSSIQQQDSKLSSTNNTFSNLENDQKITPDDFNSVIILKKSNSVDKLKN